MKFTRAELIKHSGHITTDADVVIVDEAFASSSLINGTQDVHVNAESYLDEEHDQVFVRLDVSGIMRLPDAITGEEIEHPFELSEDEVFAFADTDDDGVRVVTDDVIDLLPAVIDDILLEVPLQVTTATSDEYPSGDGWRIITEEAYQKSLEDQIDPRLAILKDFKSEEE